MINRGIIDTLKSFTYSLDELYENDLAELNSFVNIERLDELIELLVSLEDNETFNKISKLEVPVEDIIAFDYDFAKIPLIMGLK